MAPREPDLLTFIRLLAGLIVAIRWMAAFTDRKRSVEMLGSASRTDRNPPAVVISVSAGSDPGGSMGVKVMTWTGIAKIRPDRNGLCEKSFW
jgi:hypothetical protein